MRNGGHFTNFFPSRRRGYGGIDESQVLIRLMISKASWIAPEFRPQRWPQVPSQHLEKLTHKSLLVIGKTVGVWIHVCKSITVPGKSIQNTVSDAMKRRPLLTKKNHASSLLPILLCT